MVIIEPDQAASRVARESEELEEPEEGEREGRQFFWGMGPQYPNGFVMQRWYPVFQQPLGWNPAQRVTPLKPVQPVTPVKPAQPGCYTSKGALGECVTLNSCYDLLYALPKNLPSWALGSKDSCIVQNAQADSMGYVSTYGVCCSRKTPNPVQSRKPTPQEPVTLPERQFGGPGFGGPPQGGQGFGGPPPPGFGGPPPPGFGGPPQQQGPPPQQQGPPPQQPAPQRPPPQQPAPAPAPEPAPAPIEEVSVDDEIASTSSSSSGGTDYSVCGMGRNAIIYNEDGEEQEQEKRITGKHPLRVAGGWPADKNEWPWIVMMMNRGNQFCDGSIIDEYHILTAAHCVAQMRASDVTTLTVRAGAHNLKNSARETGVQNFGVKLVVKHKDFTMETLHSDIAILVLKEPIKYSSTVRRVCLPSSSTDTYEGKMGTVVGWGLLREGGSRPTVLMELSMKIWNNDKCRTTYGSTAPAGIKSTMMCAGKQGKDSCSGDSGGPFVTPVGDHWEQIGVVSWGIGCGKQHYPGVYTRVNKMMDWIDKVRKLYPN